jgi:FkbM family methyltransferase
VQFLFGCGIVVLLLSFSGLVPPGYGVESTASAHAAHTPLAIAFQQPAAAALPCPVAPACPAIPACSAAPPRAPPPGAGCPASRSAAVAANVAFMRSFYDDETLGFADSRALLPFLWRFFSATGPRVLLIDIGANLGDTSSAFQAHFSQSDCYRYEPRLVAQNAHFDACRDWPARVIAYEPMPDNFAVLKKRAEEEGWQAAGWRGFAAAITSVEVMGGDSARSGNAEVKFYGKNQQGALSSGAAAAESFVAVKAWTLDAHLASIGEADAEILLLKVDTEGFDGHALLSMNNTLLGGRTAFLVFEYNSCVTPSGDRQNLPLFTPPLTFSLHPPSSSLAPIGSGTRGKHTSPGLLGLSWRGWRVSATSATTLHPAILCPFRARGGTQGSRYGSGATWCATRRETGGGRSWWRFITVNDPCRLTAPRRVISHAFLSHSHCGRSATSRRTHPE